MNFTVIRSMQVSIAVESLSPALRDFVLQIESILAETPYEFRDVIRSERDGNGRTYYQYHDGIVPLVFQYRVYPRRPEWRAGHPGLVWIARASTLEDLAPLG